MTDDWKEPLRDVVKAVRYLPTFDRTSIAQKCVEIEQHVTLAVGRVDKQLAEAEAEAANAARAAVADDLEKAELRAACFDGLRQMLEDVQRGVVSIPEVLDALKDCT